MKAATAAPSLKPMDPEEYRRVKALLCQAIEMLAGSQPFDASVLSDAEETGMRLKREVAADFGREAHTVSELEKKGIDLRQKHDLAESLFQAVDRAKLAVLFAEKRLRFMQKVVRGAVTALISALCGVLSFQSVRMNARLTTGAPNVWEVLRSFLNSQSLIPFLGFQLIAGVLAVSTVVAIYECWKAGHELHQLRRAMQDRQMDPRMIAALPMSSR